MKKYIGVVFFILIALPVGTLGMLYAAAADPVQAGVAAAVNGDVKATTPPDKMPHVLKSGDKVFLGDRIETGTAGRLQILLLDQTVFTLGPLSSLTVDDFVYDPTNDNGKLKARVAQGIFRVVSGKIAHKKPENMLVDLPAGAIGFRGTNVAGIVDGQRSLIVLLGPVGTGRIYVTNVVNGEVIGVDIDQAGKATIVDGPNRAPVAVFQVSEADLNRIANALGQPVSDNGTSRTSGVSTGASALAKAQVKTQELADLLNTVDKLNQTTMTAAQDKARESAKDESHASGSQHQTNHSIKI